MPALIIVWTFCLTFALIARYGIYHDRPDLHGLAWWPMILAALVGTILVLLIGAG